MYVTLRVYLQRHKTVPIDEITLLDDDTFSTIVYSKTSLYRPTMALTLNGAFIEGGRFRELKHHNGIVWEVVWDSNKSIDIGEWSICECDRIERLYCTHKRALSVSTSITLFGSQMIAHTIPL